jgi:IclR family transcriptional regulator, acetate operon repressor
MSDYSQSPLGRAFEVLKTLVRKGKPSSLDEITREVNLPRPTVYRLLATLTEMRLLEKDPNTRRYGLGLNFLSLTQQANASSWPSIERREILKALVAEIGETCNFVIRSGDQILWLDRIETQDPVRLHLEPGITVPLPCTAAGKLYLSYMSENEIEKLLERQPLKRYTDKTITQMPDLLRELKTIRKTRLSFDRGEYIQDTAAVAVPVENTEGELIAALSAHGPSYRFSQQAVQRFIPKLLEAARKIRHDLLPPTRDGAPDL